jgi:hypothetical protein
MSKTGFFRCPHKPQLTILACWEEVQQVIYLMEANNGKQ